MSPVQFNVLMEVIGWCSTALFISSFLVRRRSLLHALGLAACILKMVYSYHYSVWPLFVNWVLLLFIELVQWRKYLKEEEEKGREQVATESKGKALEELIKANQ